MKYARIVAEFCGRAWALPEETLMAIVDLLRLQAGGAKWSQEEIRERIDTANAEKGYISVSSGEARFVAQDRFDDAQEGLPMRGASGKRNAASPGSVAVIPIMGVISQRMNLMAQLSGSGGTSIEKLTGQFRQALGDSNCKAIIFDVDSPGGSVNGVPELAAEIFKGRKQKPIVAVCNSMAASAAYWLASAASEVVTTPTALVGSIGVFMTHQDESDAMAKEGIKITIIKAGKYKAEGNPTEPLSDDAQAFLKSQVDDVYTMFVKAVAQQRGTSQTTVRDGYGQGRALLGSSAVKAGLADRLGSMDDVLAKYGVKSSSQVSALDDAGDITAKTRAEKLAARTEADDDMSCACPCDACKACTGSAEAKAEGDAGCLCPCGACSACDKKSAHAAAIAQITRAQELATAEEKRITAEAAGTALIAIEHRRRDRELALMRMKK